MGLSKQQESIIIDILGFMPETWTTAITLQADKIPKENRVEFGERLLNKIASYQSKAQHAASILRRGPNLDPIENLKAFSLVHASYLASLFIAHPTLCERLCDNLTKTQNNHGWEGEIGRLRAIETHKLEIKDYVAEEVNRTPVGDIDERFSLMDMVAVIEYVGQHPSVCRKMFDLWPEYYIFQEYSFEAWKVIEEEIAEEEKEMRRTYLANTVSSTRTTRSGTYTFAVNDPLSHAPAGTHNLAVNDPLPHPPTTSINQGKRSRPNFGGSEAKDDKEGKGPTSKRARHDHQDQSLSLSSPLKL
ncbi:hypothetical protein DSL72_006887 [Monilinia vaccinii-corymbosi]|uniref:Uncharacterized protein n=1 Tax=Monilinia vaccinii-corymbosi TaxID=61207 RepID=A0A8A3PLA0_9HELO|nr:hypothetical protein DSL72_006887 [Monilinia vaccinii-corymbosi]